MSVGSEEFTIVDEMTAITEPAGKKDETYYWTKNVTFSVEEILFRVSPYSFILGSEYFVEKYGLLSDEDCIGAGSVVHLEGVTATQFRVLLKFLFPVHLTSTTSTFTKEEWLTILTLSTLWHFHDSRKLAIQHLDGQLSDLELILVGRDAYVPRWVLSGYRAIVERPRLYTLTEDIGDAIGHREVNRLWAIRYHCAVFAHDEDYVGDVLREKFRGEMDELAAREMEHRTKAEVERDERAIAERALREAEEGKAKEREAGAREAEEREKDAREAKEASEERAREDGGPVTGSPEEKEVESALSGDRNTDKATTEEPAAESPSKDASGDSESNVHAETQGAAGTVSQAGDKEQTEVAKAGYYDLEESQAAWEESQAALKESQDALEAARNAEYMAKKMAKKAKKKLDRGRAAERAAKAEEEAKARFEEAQKAEEAFKRAMEEEKQGDGLRDALEESLEKEERTKRDEREDIVALQPTALTPYHSWNKGDPHWQAPLTCQRPSLTRTQRLTTVESPASRLSSSASTHGGLKALHGRTRMSQFNASGDGQRKVDDDKLFGSFVKGWL